MTGGRPAAICRWTAWTLRGRRSGRRRIHKKMKNSESPELISSIQEVLDELNIQYFDMYSMQSGLDTQAILFNAIKEAQIVIAVLTHNMSNVLFELGLAVGSGKAVFLLIDNPEHIPFDLLGMTCIKINENLKEILAVAAHTLFLWTCFSRKESNE